MAKEFYSEAEIAAKIVSLYGEDVNLRLRKACKEADDLIINLCGYKETRFQRVMIAGAYIKGYMQLGAIDEFMENLGDYEADYARSTVNAHTLYLDFGAALAYSEVTR